MAAEGTLPERAHAARARLQATYQRERLEQDQWENKRMLAFVNRVLGSQLTVDDLQQVVVKDGEGEGRVEYRFTIDGQNFALTGADSFSVLRSCVMCQRLVATGSISTYEVAIAEASGGDFDQDRVLAKVADLLEIGPYCWYHRQPEQLEHTELEARVRQLVREEMEAAGLADGDHSHPELADEHHEHYEFAHVHHEHDINHSHHGEYADLHHVH